MKKFNHFAVIMPSYNEFRNIVILIEKINCQLPGSKIIIVDDSPQDENLKIRKIIQKNKNVKIISRFKKLGRGSAVVQGLRDAYKDKSKKYFFEMDSDLAHDPAEFKRFIEELEVYPFNLIIGSRYKSGGEIKNIEKKRTILSRLINYFLYFWLNIKISDYTSGFRLYDRIGVQFVLNHKIKSTGFITLSEIAYKLYKKNYSISEVPVTWNYRKFGNSNVNFRELIKSLIFVIFLRFENFD